MSVQGYDGMTTREINPERDGYCHPAQAKRTLCVCGRVLQFIRVTDFGEHATRCKCGRVHVKAWGSAFQHAIGQPIRPGGRKGCPGCWIEETPTPTAPQGAEGEG